MQRINFLVLILFILIGLQLRASPVWADSLIGTPAISIQNINSLAILSALPPDAAGASDLSGLPSNLCVVGAPGCTETAYKQAREKYDIKCDAGSDGKCWLKYAEFQRGQFPCMYDASCDAYNGQALVMGRVEEYFGFMRNAIAYYEDSGWFTLNSEQETAASLLRNGLCATADIYVDSVKRHFDLNTEEGDLNAFLAMYKKQRQTCYEGRSTVARPDFIFFQKEILGYDKFALIGLLQTLDPAFLTISLNNEDEQENGEKNLAKILHNLSNLKLKTLASAITDRIKLPFGDIQLVQLRNLIDLIALEEVRRSHWKQAQILAETPRASDTTLVVYLALASYKKK